MREQEMADAILEYLAEHPQASDTLEGIAEWWIMRQQIQIEIERLKKVLHRLTHQGVLEKIGEGDKARYRLKAKPEDSRSKDDQPSKSISKKNGASESNE